MELPEFPWIYPFAEDAAAAGRYAGGRMVLRPLVEVSVAGAVAMEQKILALVDSGSEHTLAAPGIARAIGLDPGDAFREISLGIGGDTVRAHFLDGSMRLHPPGGSIDDFEEWPVEIGFVHQWRAPWQILLGQVGFFSRWTVTIQRDAQALAVEPYEAFDDRYGRYIGRPSSSSA